MSTIAESREVALRMLKSTGNTNSGREHARAAVAIAAALIYVGDAIRESVPDFTEGERALSQIATEIGATNITLRDMQ